MVDSLVSINARTCQPRNRTLAIGLVLMLLIAACSQEAPDSVSLENLPRFQLTEVLSLGDEASPDGVFFGDIEGRVAAHRDGRIFAGDRQEFSIYAFSPGGELLATIGSEGEGPGEFSYLSAVRLGPADTLYAYDYSSERITAFESASYDYLYDITIAAEDAEGNWPGDFIGAVPSGFLVTFEDPHLISLEDFEGNVRARLIDWQGHIVDGLVVQLRATKRMVVPLPGGSLLATRVPFNRTPVFRSGPDGRLYSGTTDSISIEIHGADGTQRGGVSVSVEPAAVTRGDIDAYLERFEGDEVSPVRTHPLFDVHNTKPAYSTFVVDDAYRVWVQMPQSAADSTMVRWILLDAESTPIGEAALPASATLEAVVGDRAYTVAVDEADVQTLVVYEIGNP